MPNPYFPDSEQELNDHNQQLADQEEAERLLDESSQGGDYYNSFSDALKMLERQCDPLKFEVFMTYTNMISEGALKEFKPNDVMLHAMMEWDLA